MPNSVDPGLVKAYVDLMRPQNAAGSIITFCIGFLLGNGMHFNGTFLLGAVILLLLHSQATIQNDIEDFIIDRSNKRSGALQDGSISQKDARQAELLLGAAAVVLTFLASPRGLHLGFVLCLMLLSWAYNCAPFRLSRRPVLSIVTMGLCFGALPITYGYFLAHGKVGSFFWIIACAWFLLRVSTAILKDYKDAYGDKLHHKHTFYLHYGPKITAWVSLLTCLIAYPVVLAIIYRHRNLPLAATIIFVLACLVALRSIAPRYALLGTKNEKQLNQLFIKTVTGHNYFEAILLLCLLFSR